MSKLNIIDNLVRNSSLALMRTKSNFMTFLTLTSLLSEQCLLVLSLQPTSGSILNHNQLLGKTNLHFLRRSNDFPRHPVIYTPPTLTNEPGTTPEKATISPEEERLTDEKGIRIPPDECIMSWDKFKEHVIGRNWLDIYDIDDDDALFPGSITKAHTHWNLINDTHVRRDASFRIETPDQCLYIWGIEKRAREAKAVFRPRLGNSLLFSGRVDYAVSSDPNKYLIYLFCYMPQRDGRCPLGITVLLVKDEREWKLGGNAVPEGPIKLNDIPWSDIEKTMIKCFSRKFKDNTHPQINWSWQGEECAVPRSDIHNAAIGNA